MGAGLLFPSGNSMDEWKRSVHMSVETSRQREDIFKNRRDQLIEEGCPIGEAFDRAWSEIYGPAYNRD